MKNMRKFASLLMVLALVLSLATTAFAAADTQHTIDIANTTKGYEYVAYQIFKGTLVEGELQDITWGDNISDGAALLAALKTEVTAFKDCKTVVDVATVLSKITTDDHETTKAFADVVAKYLTDGVAGTSQEVAGEEDTITGYEITVEGDGYYFVKNTKVPDGAAFTRYILKVVGDVDIKHKGTVPEVDKQIVGGTTTETGDYSIGDDITYQLIGTLPENYADYKTYKYVFHDQLTAGLDLIASFDETDATKVVSGVTVKVGDKDITSSFTITYADRKLTVACNDLKTISDLNASSKIVVEYKAEMNANAVVGGVGNPNTVHLEFSNDPNFKGEGEKSPTEETPEDTVVVFTFELDVTKVDGVNNDTKLEGAKFKLQNAAGKWVTVDANGKVTGWVDTQDAGSVLTSDANGFFKISGLEDGVYDLVETEAPEGYNILAEAIVITITSTYDETGVKTLTIKVDNGNEKDGNTSTGIVETTVKNNSGAILPGTGGIGTTIFYIVGGILVVAAVVLLVTKRRMRTAE